MRVPSNPILARELKERMRTLRAPVVLTIYLLILGGVAFATERLLAPDSAFNPLAAAGIGRAMFHFLLFFTLLLICFLVPGFTASSVSSERERQTFPLLQVTLLRPRSIVIGKLTSSIAFMVLLMVATLPLMSVSFILGGVTPLDVLRGYGMVLATGFTIAIVGIALSSRLRRTVSSTVLAYGIVAILCVGTVASYGLQRMVVERGGGNPTGHIWGLVVNPFVGTASALRGTGATAGPSSPFTSLFGFLDERPFVQRAFGGRAVIVQDGVEVPVPADVPVPLPADRFGNRGFFVDEGQPLAQASADSFRLPAWAGMLIWYTAISALSYLVAVNGVKAPARGLRLFRRRARMGEA